MLIKIYNIISPLQLFFCQAQPSHSSRHPPPPGKIEDDLQNEKKNHTMELQTVLFNYLECIYTSLGLVWAGIFKKFVLVIYMSLT